MTLSSQLPPGKKLFLEAVTSGAARELGGPLARKASGKEPDLPHCLIDAPGGPILEILLRSVRLSCRSQWPQIIMSVLFLVKRFAVLQHSEANRAYSVVDCRQASADK